MIFKNRIDQFLRHSYMEIVRENTPMGIRLFVLRWFNFNNHPIAFYITDVIGDSIKIKDSI